MSSFLFFLLIIISPFQKMNTVCGLKIIPSLITTNNVNQRDDVDEKGILQLKNKSEIIYFSYQFRGQRSNDKIDLFENRSQYTIKSEDENILCRAPDGHYLPIDLFALDTCARCYHYIPDNPSFFHRNSKWNYKVVRMQSVQTRNLFYNVTFLVQNINNMTVSLNHNIRFLVFPRDNLVTFPLFNMISHSYILRT